MVIKGKKKKKSKGSKGRTDAWALDGGGEHEGKKEYVDDTGKRVQRRTQEQDESRRRGNLKGIYANQIKAKERKLKHKIEFDSFVPADPEEGEYSFDYMDDDKERSEKPDKERQKSSLSVIHRLQKLSGDNESNRILSNSAKSLVSSFFDTFGSDEEDDEEYDEGDDEEEKGGEREPSEDKQSSNSTREEELETDEQGHEGNLRAYEYLFPAVAQAAPQPPQSKLALLDQIGPDFVVHGVFNDSVQSPVKLRGGSRAGLASVYGTGLPKLWRQGNAAFPGLQSSVRGPSPEERHSTRKRARRKEAASLDTDDPRFVAAMLRHITQYADVLLEGRDAHTDHSILRCVLIHACVHIVRARLNVLKHNTRLRRKLQAAKMRKATERERRLRKEAGLSPEPEGDSDGGHDSDKNGVDGGDEDGDKDSDDDQDPGKGSASEGSIQDQGFVRPRVLILCPFRGVAYRIFELMQAILGENTTVASLDKMVAEFGSADFASSDEEDEEELDGESKRGMKRHKPPPKPDDWRYDFHQNVDDDFKLGMQVNPGKGKGGGANKGVYLRLFSDFFISDVIIASPLGLRLIIEKFQNEVDEDEVTSQSVIEKSKQTNEALAMRNADFLSSLEMIIVHQADILYMQNWDHVEFVMNLVNRLPKSNHDTDFARVRPYFLDGKAREHRQLILTSHFLSPHLQAFFRQHGHSLGGSLRVKRKWPVDGVITSVAFGRRQVFQKVAAASLDEEEESRFEYFKEHVLGPILRTGQGRTLIVAPSYLHYVRIRNELMRLEANSAFVCEYSRDSEISRGRSRFYHGLHEILLYSGRCHFFRRFPIKGAQHLVLYSLPEYPHFYPEFLNLLTNEVRPGAHAEGGYGANTSACTSTALFTRYDKMALERIVGTKKAAHMLSSDKPLFMFQ